MQLKFDRCKKYEYIINKSPINKAFLRVFFVQLFQLTYTLSKQLGSLHFDYFSCYKRIKFPPHLPVTSVLGAI